MVQPLKPRLPLGEPHSHISGPSQGWQRKDNSRPILLMETDTKVLNQTVANGMERLKRP